MLIPYLSFKVKFMDNECIHIYTDGASKGNPGPSGCGIYINYKDTKLYNSYWLGDNKTNNYAELTAIKLALSLIKNKSMPIIIYTDSQYCIGVLTKNWKKNINQKLIEEIERLIEEFKYITFIKVKAHSTNEGNNMADQLANEAIKTKSDNFY